MKYQHQTKISLIHFLYLHAIKYANAYAELSIILNKKNYCTFIIFYQNSLNNLLQTLYSLNKDNYPYKEIIIIKKMNDNIQKYILDHTFEFAIHFAHNDHELNSLIRGKFVIVLYAGDLIVPNNLIKILSACIHNRYSYVLCNFHGHLQSFSLNALKSHVLDQPNLKFIKRQDILKYFIKHFKTVQLGIRGCLIDSTVFHSVFSLQYTDIDFLLPYLNCVLSFNSVVYFPEVLICDFQTVTIRESSSQNAVFAKDLGYNLTKSQIYKFRNCLNFIHTVQSTQRTKTISSNTL